MLKAKGRLQTSGWAQIAQEGSPRAHSTFFLEAYGPKYDKAAACLAKESRRPADVLRLPRRALEACTQDQPGIESTFVQGSSAHLPDQGLPVAQDGDGHGLQTMPVQLRENGENSMDFRTINAEILIRGVKFVDGERQDRAAA